MDVRTIEHARSAVVSKWIEIGDGARLQIARMGNPAYVDMLEEDLEPYTQALRDGTMCRKLVEKLYIHALAHTILLGWEGIEENGKPLDYSPDEAMRLLRTYPAFLHQIEELADKRAFYDKRRRRDGEKNLKKSSTGT